MLKPTFINEVEMSDSSKLYNIIYIESHFRCDNDSAIIPLTPHNELNENQFYYPVCNCFAFDTVTKTLSFYTKNFPRNDLTQKIKTLILLECKEENTNKRFYIYGNGFLLGNDTVKVPAIAYFENNAFQIMDRNGLVWVETKIGRIENNRLEIKYNLPEKQLNENVKVFEKYVFKYYKNVKVNVLADGYECE